MVRRGGRGDMLTKEAWERAIRLLPFLASVSTEDWRRASVIRIEPDARHPIHGRHRLAHAAFVLDGRIRIHQLGDTGREVTLYRLGPGEGCVLMMASILGETEYGASAEVELSTELLLLPAAEFKRWTFAYEPVSQYVYRQFIHRMRHVTNVLDDVIFRTMNYRVSRFLLQHTDAAEPVLVCTHERVADELGTAREVISRVLKEFERAGIVRLGRGRIEVLNRAGLEDME